MNILFHAEDSGQFRSISQWGGLSQSLDVERICWQPWLQNCRDLATQKQEETVFVLQKPTNYSRTARIS